MKPNQILQTYPLVKTETAMPELIDRLFHLSIVQFVNRKAFEKCATPNLLNVRSIDVEISTIISGRNSYVIYDENFGLTLLTIIKHIINPSLDKKSLTKELISFFGKQLYIKGNIPGAGLFTYIDYKTQLPQENYDEDFVELIIQTSILFAINHELSHYYFNSLGKRKLEEAIEMNKISLTKEFETFKGLTKGKWTDDDFKSIECLFNDRIYNEEDLCNSISYVHTISTLIDIFKIGFGKAFVICQISREATNWLTRWKSMAFEMNDIFNNFYYESTGTIKLVSLPKFDSGVEDIFNDFKTSIGLSKILLGFGYENVMNLWKMEKHLAENDFKQYSKKQALSLADVYKHIYTLFKTDKKDSNLLSIENLKLTKDILMNH